MLQNVLNTISNNVEKQFLCWTKVLEDTVSRLQQNVLYYKEFLSKFSFKSKIFTEFGCFLNNTLLNLCVVITMDIGKLYGSKNDNRR